MDWNQAPAQSHKLNDAGSNPASATNFLSLYKGKIMKRVIEVKINLNQNWRTANINIIPCIQPQGHGNVATNVVRNQKRCIN